MQLYVNMIYKEKCYKNIQQDINSQWEKDTLIKFQVLKGDIIISKNKIFY